MISDLVARMERSAMRGHRAATQEPGFRFAPSGLQACTFLALLLAAAAPSHAQSVADFYSRAPIRLIISADPGGSYDQIGRLLSRHLGRLIPGNPRVVPENMLGASGRVAANYLAHAAPKDGSVIGLIQQSIPMGQALGEGGVQYDAARFNWIGSPVRLDETLVVWHTTGVRTIEDAKRKSVIIGATSPTGMNSANFCTKPRRLSEISSRAKAPISDPFSAPPMMLAPSWPDVMASSALSRSRA